MPQVQVTDFKYGMDRRRPRSAGVPGSLWLLRNAHISRGGDIERMKKWVKYADLPAGTFGLSAVYGQLVVFGSGDLSSAMPLSVAYQRLQSPDASAMADVVDTQVFEDGIYVIARFQDGSMHHYWKGTRVADWDTLGTTAISPPWVVYELGSLASDSPAVSILASGRVLRLTAREPGTAFTVTATGAGATVIPRVANVVPVAEVNATATITVVSGPAGDPTLNSSGVALRSLKIENVEMLQEPIFWDGSTENMATAITVAINEFGGFPGVSANQNGSQVVVTAADGKGATINGSAIYVVTDPGLVVSEPTFGGGITEVKAVAQVTDVDYPGTIDAATILTVTINGTQFRLHADVANKGTNATAYKQRMWCTAGTVLRYSKLNDPGDWIDATAGFISMPAEGDSAERLVALARYENNMAVISTNQIRIWFLDVDPLKNEQQQTLSNTGSVAPQGVVQYGDTDVFYLDTPGIRSIKARSGVNTAAVNDVGTGMDTWIQALIDSLPYSTLTRAFGIIEPRDGRYMLAIGDKIVVLSVFANSKISAWSVYEPGFSPTAFVRIGKRLFARDASAIYVYGGIDGDEYPAAGEAPIEVETPFISANEPGTFKMLNHFMVDCTNVWDLNLLLDPNDPAKELWLGKVHGVTYAEQKTPMVGGGNLIALRMRCDEGGNATFSSFLIDFSKT